MTLLDQLRTVAAAYGKARTLKTGRVSTLVFGDGMKLAKIAADKADVTTSRFEKTMQWFSDHWPEGTPWPDGVARPRAHRNGGRAA